jgi:hypothetical protein
MYDALWNSKFVTGTVEEVLTDISGRRATVKLKFKWNLPGRESRKSINLRSAHADEAPHSIRASRELTLCDPSPVRPDDVEEEVAGRQDEGDPYSEDAGGTVHCAASDESVGVTVVATGVEWIAKTALQPIGRPVPRRVWAVQSLSGHYGKWRRHKNDDSVFLRIFYGYVSARSTRPHRSFDIKGAGR